MRRCAPLHRNAHPQGLFAKALHRGAADLAFIFQFGDGRGTAFGQPVVAGSQCADRACLQVGVAAVEMVEAGLLGTLAHDQ